MMCHKLYRDIPRVALLAVALLAGLMAPPRALAEELNLSTNIRVRTATAAAIPVGGRGLATGVVSAYRKATVAAEIPGRIVERLVEPGTVARAGQVLVKIDPDRAGLRLRQAQAMADAARVELEHATHEYRRGVRLLKTNVVSQDVVDDLHFALSGVILAFFLHGLDLSMTAMIGTIGLAGVVVNASIVMLDAIHRRMADERGTRPPLEIMQEAVISRLRPILVTTLTTLGGVLPTAYGIGGYDTIVSPMSVAIGWGLLFSTSITLFVVPVLFSIAQDINHRFNRGHPEDHIDNTELQGLTT